MLANSVAANAPAATDATFSIVVPPKTAQAAFRSPQYVSSAVQSAVITLTSVNGAPYAGPSATIATNLTSSSPACAVSGLNLVCTVPAAAVVGSDTYTVTTYDAPQTSATPATPAGNALSAGTTSLTIVSGQTASGTLVLNGIAAKVAVATADAHVTGSLVAGLTIVGNAPAAFTATALDAAGNTIVGPGTPSLAVATANAAVAVTNGASGAFTMQVKTWSATPIALTITPSSGSASASSVTTVQELWVADNAAPSATANAIAGFNALTGAAIAADVIPASTTGTLVAFLSTDADGNLWAPTDAAPGRLMAFAPGSLTPRLTISSAAISAPRSVLVRGTDIYVSDTNGGLLKFTNAAGLTGTQTLTPAIQIAAPIGTFVGQLCVDQSGLIWDTAYDGVNSTDLAYDTNLVAQASLTGRPGRVGAFAPNGNLWLADSFTNIVTGYQRSAITAIGTTLTPLATLSGAATGFDQPRGLAFDATGNLWVGSFGTSVPLRAFSAAALTAGGNVAPMQTIGTRLRQPIGMAFTP